LSDPDLQLHAYDLKHSYHISNSGDRKMLVLSRKRDQSIVIDGNIRVTVLNVKGQVVRLGFEAPNDVTIVRSEIAHRGNVHSQRTEALALDLAESSYIAEWEALI
jgi:carbon storage regulator